MRIAVLTAGRQDWGILRSTCRALHADPRFDLRLLVGGMHCDERFGRSEQWITEDGLEAAERVPWLDGPEVTATAQTGRAVTQIGAALHRQAPDALLLIGDRYETAAAALAATLASVPLVHLHGGEETEGAFDNALRHAITKLSHLHLTSHPSHARRVLAMGEAADAIHVVGAPGLDNLHRKDLATREELERALQLTLEPPVVLVTLHPATHGGDPRAEVEATVVAMDQVEATYVITLPNSDPGHSVIRARLERAAGAARRVAVAALGERRFWGLLRQADAMLGNSSSALIEAPAVGLPAVNVGDRQRGRLRGGNVIDAPAEATAIVAALRRALSPEFRKVAGAAPSPFGDGGSAARILAVLSVWHPPRPPRKPIIPVSP